MFSVPGVRTGRDGVKYTLRANITSVAISVSTYICYIYI